MNLSNYLQMPPAPTTPPSPQTGPAKGTAPVVGLDSTGNMKLDFAQIMARQFQQMPQLKRQDLAASGSLTKLAAAAKDTRDNENNASSNADSARQSDRFAAQANDAHAYIKNAAANDKADDQDHTRDDDRADDRQTRRVRSTAQDDAASAALWLNPLSASVSLTPTQDTADAAALTNLPDGTPLQTVTLSTQTQLITDPRHAPSPQSLMAFAQSMGMDPEAISQLMGNADAANLASNGAPGLATANGQTAAQLASGLTQNLSAHQGMTQLQANLAAAMQANGQGQHTGEAAAMVTSMTATHIQAQSVGSPSQAVHLPATPAMSTLQMLSPTDPNAALNNAMSMNMLPVAPAVASGSNTSFTATLDLHSAELPESQITALAGLFAESGQADGSSLSQDSQAGSDSGHGSFAQAMAGKTDAANGNDATQRNAAANGVNRPMSEVYEKLSEKLSTEMAARMHEQLSAGQWKMKFGLRPAHLGGVEVQLEMKDGKLNAQLNAENPMTRELLHNSSQRLRESLANLGVQTNQVTVGQNQSGFAQSGSQGQTGGNPSQVGDNLSSSVGPDAATSDRSSDKGTKASDTLLDLYA